MITVPTTGSASRTASAPLIRVIADRQAASGTVSMTGGASALGMSGEKSQGIACS